MSSNQPTPEDLSPSSTTTTTTPPYTPDPAFQPLTLLKLNMKHARSRQGMYLTLTTTTDDAPNVLYCPSQPWSTVEVDRFHATGHPPRGLEGGGIVGATHGVWLFPWCSSEDQLPAMDLDDLPDPETQLGLVYFARGDREVRAFGGEAKVIGMNLTMVKLVEIGGGQGRLEVKGGGLGPGGFVDLAKSE